MTSGPPQPPDEPTTPAAPTPPEPGPAESGDATPAAPAKPVEPAWFAIAAVVLGILGCALLAIMLNPDNIRMYVTAAIGLPGLVIGVVGLTGPRRAKGWAAAGAILSVIAFGAATVNLVDLGRKEPANVGDGDHTGAVLRDDLDVRLGERLYDPESEVAYVSVTLTNKGPDEATFSVTFDVDDLNGSCEAEVTAVDLPPGGSYQEMMAGCRRPSTQQHMAVQLTKAEKSVGI